VLGYKKTATSKFPRRGYGEFVSELVSFAKKAHDLATMWMGADAVVALAAEIRKISGFGGKGFRMKEIILDLAESAKAECTDVAHQLLDFGIVGPGPRRALNFVNNRRWFITWSILEAFITPTSSLIVVG